MTAARCCCTVPLACISMHVMRLCMSGMCVPIYLGTYLLCMYSAFGLFAESELLLLLTGGTCAFPQSCMRVNLLGR